MTKRAAWTAVLCACASVGVILYLLTRVADLERRLDWIAYKMDREDADDAHAHQRNRDFVQRGVGNPSAGGDGDLPEPVPPARDD